MIFSRYGLAVMSVALLLGLVRAHCGHAAEKPADDDAAISAGQWPSATDHERFTSEVVGALERADPAAMSLLVNFPLRVNFSDRTTILIGDEYTLQKRFNEIFPKAFRDHIVAVSKAGTGEDGWAGNGYMLANGSLWARQFGEPPGARFRIDVVNAIVSDQPDAPRPTLFACETVKHRIVVDAGGSKGSLRYRAWNKPHFPPAAPNLTLLDGARDSGGTGACFAWSWRFNKGDTHINVRESKCTFGSDGPPGDARAVVEVTAGAKPMQQFYCY